MQKCGSCGTMRETGEICCLAQAENQGRLHSTCSHGAPTGTAPELERIYEAAREAALAEGDTVPPPSY